MQARWVEYLVKAWDAFMEDLFSFIPEESKKHLMNARKEVLLAFKSALEKKIEELETEKKEVKKIKVEREK
ncbi:MAG: hypothetical protein ABWJ99_05940 [Caldimicrobium sp.]